jgi:predicted RNA-binding protein associated with RNAse of E/G family
MRGWYGNVTYPACFDKVEGEQVLVWHDLYLDVVILPDGSMHLLDDDELEESGISGQDPEFAAAIVQARLDLIEAIPFLG